MTASTRLRRTLLSLFVMAAFVVQTGPSHAQMASPEPIEQLIPAEWRSPRARFLSELGADNVEAILDSAKLGPIAASRSSVLRLEHPSLCFKDTCLTIIGHINNSDLVPQAMFTAGRMVTRGDVFGNFLGHPIPPPLYFLRSKDFENDHDIVAVLETAKGWVVMPRIR